MENIKDPIQIVATYGAMTAKQCSGYLPDMTPKIVDAKLRQAFRVGKLARRIDESCTTNRSSYIYFDASGRVSNREPEYCVVLRTLGKPLETTHEIY